MKIDDLHEIRNEALYILTTINNRNTPIGLKRHEIEKSVAIIVETTGKVIDGITDLKKEVERIVNEN